MRVFVGHSGPVSTIAMSPDGRYLASAGRFLPPFFSCDTSADQASYLSLYCPLSGSLSHNVQVMTTPSISGISAPLGSLRVCKGTPPLSTAYPSAMNPPPSSVVVPTAPSEYGMLPMLALRRVALLLSRLPERGRRGRTEAKRCSRTHWCAHCRRRGRRS